MITALLAIAMLQTACADIEVVQPVDGSVLVTIETEDLSTRLCIVNRHSVAEVPIPSTPELKEAIWGADGSELLMPACSGSSCRIGRYGIDGTLRGVFPPGPQDGMVLPDGRIEQWKLRQPRADEKHELLAARNGEGLVVLELQSDSIRFRYPRSVREYAFGPRGYLAFTASPSEQRSAGMEAQLFVVDINSGNITQLTDFRPKVVSSTWLPWSKKRRVFEVVGNLAWTSDPNSILFMRRDDPVIHLVAPTGRPLGSLELSGQCLGRLRPRTGRKDVMYLSSTKPSLCVGVGSDELRLASMDGKRDFAIAKMRTSKAWMISVDWHE